MFHEKCKENNNKISYTHFGNLISLKSPAYPWLITVAICIIIYSFNYRLMFSKGILGRNGRKLNYENYN